MGMLLPAPAAQSIRGSASRSTSRFCSQRTRAVFRHVTIHKLFDDHCVNAPAAQVDAAGLTSSEHRCLFTMKKRILCTLSLHVFTDFESHKISRTGSALRRSRHIAWARDNILVAAWSARAAACLAPIRDVRPITLVNR